ncbi:hypothetical protein [Acidithiobacillus sulfuriphilus]|uniref:hypothetical protein n=1 Tax=Acidithiobacillus sulfuriphilus TaxID=1867749 RepID=UPI003F5E2640
MIASQAYACLNIRVIEIDAGRLWNVWRRTLSAEHTAAHSAARAKVGENAGIVQIPNPFGFLDPGRNIFRIMAMADNASSPESNSRGISLSPREGRYSGIKIYNRFCIVAIMISLCFLGLWLQFFGTMAFIRMMVGCQKMMSHAERGAEQIYRGILM